MNLCNSPKIDRLSRSIDKALVSALPKPTRVPVAIHKAMHYCVFSGGKRFRPLLCLGACEAVGAHPDKALACACSVELIHTYSLVHDDLPAMDNANERRGRPSCHRQFGEANAILVGDALLTLAFDLLSRNGTSNALRMIRLLGEASGTSGLIGGQVLDLEPAGGRRRVTAERLTQIAQRKTAALITASVLCGALAGGVRGARLERLKRYGELMGLAFQLIDDLHDKEGFAHVLGSKAVRVRAHRLIAQARKILLPFGNRANTLRQLAQWLEASA